jgi:hypothetical protein
MGLTNYQIARKACDRREGRNRSLHQKEKSRKCGLDKAADFGYNI